MIQAKRIQADIEAIAACTETPGGGASRPTFSPSWRKARDYVQKELEAIGCRIRIDAAGNLHARPAGIAWEVSAWVSGSHLDSVPHGGNFDGVVGVVAPLEAMRAARESVRIALPLELVIWAEEEGTTFGLGMIGSRLAIGDLSIEAVERLKNAEGQDYFVAGAPHGVVKDKVASDRFMSGNCVGLIEVHIEQGPSLWNIAARAGIVTAIAGRRQYRCEIRGVANHAGSTGMSERLDALVGAAEIINGLEKLALELGNGLVITVGQLFVKPNAINVISESVEFSIDLRGPSDVRLITANDRIHKLIERIADERRLGQVLKQTESQPAVEMDKRICAKLEKGAEKIGVEPVVQTISGALHDAAILAPQTPTAMLFVPSQDGISHNSGEFSKLEDIASAAGILLETVRDRRLE